MHNLPFDFPISIKKSSTRSAKLHVKDGQVIVSVPRFTSDGWVNEFITKNLNWIKERLQFSQQQSKLTKQFISGELIPFRGQLFAIQIEKASVGRIKIGEKSGNFLVEIPTTLSPRLTHTAIRKTFLTWYKRQAKLVINTLCAKYAKALGKPFGQIRLKDTSSRWGSCSSEGNLNFNWRLILAPPEILEYVVVHEICHLKHQHHQASFWKEVSRFDLSYRQHRRWLKTNGWKLHV